METGHKQDFCLERWAEEREDKWEGHLERCEGGDRRECLTEEVVEEAEAEEVEEKEKFWRFLSVVYKQWRMDREADECFPELWHKAGILETRKATAECLLSPAALLLLLSACKHTP